MKYPASDRHERSDGREPRSLATGSRDRPAAHDPGERHGAGQRENFPVASLLLPRRAAPHLLAIYGFARLVDDVGDEAAGDRLALLDELEADLERVCDGGAPQQPADRAPAADRRALRAARSSRSERLIEANRRDQMVHRYETLRRAARLLRAVRQPGRRARAARSSARRRPSGSRSRTRSAPRSSCVEHWQDVAEDYAAGASTCRPRTSRASACAEQRSRRERPPAPALRGADGVRGGARARAARRGRSARRARCRGRARLAVAAFVGRRARGARRDRARRLRRAGRRPARGRARRALELADAAARGPR